MSIAIVVYYYYYYHHNPPPPPPSPPPLLVLHQTPEGPDCPPLTAFSCTIQHPSATRTYTASSSRIGSLKLTLRPPIRCHPATISWRCCEATGAAAGLRASWRPKTLGVSLRPPLPLDSTSMLLSPLSPDRVPSISLGLLLRRHQQPPTNMVWATARASASPPISHRILPSGRSLTNELK